MRLSTFSGCTFVFLFLFMPKAYSQLAQGTWLISGTGMYSVYKNKANNIAWSKTRSLDIQPNIGYFVSDKVPIGLKINGNFSNEKNPQPDGTTVSLKQGAIGFGPFVRYYFLEKENRINIFANAGALYIINPNNSTSLKSRSVDYGVAGGTEVFFNSAVGLEFC